MAQYMVDAIDWLLKWNDIIDTTVTPVISDEEAGAAFQKHGLG